VFEGGWRRDAAKAVGTGGDVTQDAVPDLLEQLIDKSLVLVEQREGEAWYRMLEPVREYAMSKLSASGEEQVIRRQHATFYVAVVDSSRPLHPEDNFSEAWFRHTRVEQDNIRAALAWCLSESSAAEMGLRLSAGVIWTGGSGDPALMKAALEHAQTVGGHEPFSFAIALYETGVLHAFHCDYPSAHANLAKALEKFRELGMREWIAALLERLGWIAREQGDTATAVARVEEALAIAKELQDERIVDLVIPTLAEALLMQGEVTRAKGLLKEVLFRGRQPQSETIGWTLNHLGHAAQIEGDYQNAERLHLESYSILSQFAARWMGSAEALFSLGETALGQGDVARATSYLCKSLTMSRDLGYCPGIAWCLASLAGVAVLNEEPERAAWLWGAAEQFRQSIGVREGPASRATHERLRAQAREEFGEDAFAAAWTRGANASSEDAMASVLIERIP
jgi:tetratricopeptide (TPR) repeat protein